MKKLELDKIQNEGYRIVTGGTKLVSLNALYDDIQWKTLEKQKKEHEITLFYKNTKQHYSNLFIISNAMT